MHCHSGNFVRFCMRSDCCGCYQNKQDDGQWISSLRRKTWWVFANCLERWLHYKVNNHPITKTKPIYHAQNVNRWKGSVETCPFIGLLIPDVINRFIFGHGIVIPYLLIHFPFCLMLRRGTFYTRSFWQLTDVHFIIQIPPLKDFKLLSFHRFLFK